MTDDWLVDPDETAEMVGTWTAATNASVATNVAAGAPALRLSNVRITRLGVDGRPVPGGTISLAAGARLPAVPGDSFLAESWSWGWEGQEPGTYRRTIEFEIRGGPWPIKWVAALFGAAAAADTKRARRAAARLARDGRGRPGRPRRPYAHGRVGVRPVRPGRPSRGGDRRTAGLGA